VQIRLLRICSATVSLTNGPPPTVKHSEAVARSWLVAYSDKCPALAFGEASNALAVVELPTDAQKRHKRDPSGVRSSKPLVPPV
jgi:hypothetical protein